MRTECTEKVVFCFVLFGTHIEHSLRTRKHISSIWGRHARLRWWSEQLMATFDWILLGANRGAGFPLHLDALSYHHQDLGQRRKVYPLPSTMTPAVGHAPVCLSSLMHLVRADWLIVCQIWFIHACKSQVGVSLATSMLRDEMSVAWNWPCLGWEYWHHGNWQVLKNHLSHFSPEMLLASWPLVRTSSSSPLNLWGKV